MTNEIPKELLTQALAFCDKSMDDMNVDIWFCDEWGCDFRTEFSIEKFFYYLLSPEFIHEYYNVDYAYNEEYFKPFWKAIYEYQKGDSQPIISLLSKIWHLNK